MAPDLATAPIFIDLRFVLLQNSQIVADAFGGPGGNIILQAQQAYLADPTSLVRASSQLNTPGAIDIQSPVTSVSGFVAPLAQVFARETALLHNRCAERLRGRTVSRFVLAGRDGLPLEPGGWLPSAPDALRQHQREEHGDAPSVSQAERGGIFLRDNAGLGQMKGTYAEVFWTEALDMECAR